MSSDSDPRPDDREPGHDASAYDPTAYDETTYDETAYDLGVPGDERLPEPAAEVSGWHPVSVGHLVMGVAFLGLTAIWALVESGAISSDDLRWLMPLPWLAAGVAGLLAVVLTGRRRGDSSRW